MAEPSHDTARPEATTREQLQSPSRIIDDYPALAAYNRSLRGLDQFERSKLRTLNRLANVARLKARRGA